MAVLVSLMFGLIGAAIQSGAGDGEYFAALSSTITTGKYILWNPARVNIPAGGHFEYDKQEPERVYVSEFGDAIFTLSGNVVSTEPEQKAVTLEWYNSAGEMITAQTLISFENSPTKTETILYNFPVATDLSEASYFKIAYDGKELKWAEIFIQRAR